MSIARSFRPFCAILGLCLCAVVAATSGCDRSEESTPQPGANIDNGRNKSTPRPKLMKAGLKPTVKVADSGYSAWHVSYANALEEAKVTGRPVLVDFTGSDWCHWCIVLKKEVFSTPEFEEWAEDNVVLLELDYPRKKKLPPQLVKQNEHLRDVTYHGMIRGYPTVLFLNSDGDVIGQTGYLRGGAAKWIASADRMLGLN